MSAKKYKIVVLGTRGFPDVQGGVETHCEHLYPLLVEKGCEVIVFARSPYVNQKIISFKGVSVKPLFCPKNKGLEAIVHTFLGVIAARLENPDLVHVHAIGPSLLIPFARLLGLRVVKTHHGPDYDRQKWGTFAKKMLMLGEYLGVLFSNEVISISHPIANIIKKRTGRKRINIIPNGVEIPEVAKGEAVLEKYGLEKGKYIFTVGRFVPEKGFHDLIEAFNLIDMDVKLVIAGDADHADEYSYKLKEQAKKNDKIILTGFIKGAPLHELYSYAGLFVLSSYHEGLPIVLLEALSYGLSCIASDIPANRNVDLGGERFFTPGDINLLADKLRFFLAEEFTYEDRDAQIKMVRENYDWAKVADSTFRVYEKVVGMSYRAGDVKK